MIATVSPSAEYSVKAVCASLGVGSVSMASALTLNVTVSMPVGEANAAGVNSGAAAERTAEDEKISSQAISPTPKGWYDAWNFRVVDQVGSFEGTKACLFENASIALNHAKQDRNEERIRAATLPEERVEITEEGEAVKNNQRERELRCQMSQSFAVDASTVKKLAVSGAYRIAS